MAADVCWVMKSVDHWGSDSAVKHLRHKPAKTPAHQGRTLIITSRSGAYHSGRCDGKDTSGSLPPSSICPSPGGFPPHMSLVQLSMCYW